ncbi:MAG: S41 family peptidase [Proteobacteria bacterium]|nr:S41 family peptidase [Pseudomonadota bacterium]MBU4257771.1 S41 family peptidase [Pseudomonadota bacterium]MBU4287164.1 S41 family peptidase [Pseudomonadota bacterium]MBU4415351.1 S41 family peptidase [Pseudomonadota bacterium]MCG2758215.1 S41 family peptidase [Desulfobacteraceae bacterium]
MTIKKRRYIKLWFVPFIAVIFWVLGTSFNHDLSASNEETYKGLKLFSDVIELIEKNYVDQVDTKELIEKAIHGMVFGLDPHSSLLPPEAFEELQIDTHGEFGGIGIVITMEKKVLTVISPIEDTPAYKAGIEAGDIIIKIDGISTKDMMLWEAVKKMRGPKGSEVVITIVRQGVAKPIDFKLIRDIIPIESVRSTALKPGYGYIRITNFQDNTTSDLKLALKELESGDIPLKGLIIDLRNNPGGLLNQAIDVSDLFLQNGEIVSIKGRLKTHTKIFNAHKNKIKHNYPIVILINGGSASASEIVAGALQDHKRALVLGTTSFGKGSVQTVEALRDGYGLKYTIARYYTPSGRSIQAQGIVPDIEVKYKIIDKEAATDEGMLKEKDLKNHLGAEPMEKDSIEKESKEQKDPTMHLLETKHGPLKIEELQSDNQVMRALEILISYEIFKSI